MLKHMKQSVKDSLKYRYKNSLRSRLSTSKIYYEIYRRVVNQKIGRIGNSNSGLPHVIYLESTNLCNARCITCTRDQMTRKAGTMDFGLYSKIVDECQILGIKEVRLHNFGEPLLDELLEEKIGYAKARGIKTVSLFTNGSLLNKKRALGIIRAGLDEINISVDGASKEVFEGIRKNLKFESVVKNTLRLQSLKEQMGISKPRIDIHCVLMEENKAELNDLIRFWRHKVDNVSVEYAHNWGNQKDHRFRAINFLRKKEPYRYPCNMLWTSLFVLWNGDISYCCLDFDGEGVVGDARINSIGEVWNNKIYRSYRRVHLDRDFARIRLCSKCSVNTDPFGWRGV